MNRQLLIVVPDLDVGGTQRFLVTLANALRTQIECKFISLSSRMPLADELDPMVSVASVGTGWRGIRAMVKHIRDQRPTWVLSSAADVNALLLALRSLLPGETRLIVRESIDPRHLPANTLKSIMLRWCYGPLHRQADLVIAQSTDMARALQARWHKHLGGRLQVVSNGVDTRRILRATGFESIPGKPYVMAAGRLVEQKGFDLLLKAFRPIADQGVTLLLAGNGPQRKALTALAYELGIDRSVVFLGETRPLWPLLAGAEYFVLPSRYEGLPNVAIEALCVGTPVLAFATETAVCELIEPARNGILLNDRRVESLALGLQTMRTMDYDRDEIRRRAAARHDISRSRDRLLELLVLCSRSAS